ncbi:hypothetical protein N7523_000429 [Penicillium sp. IBT 18751x]|nr:hypothetical protein N7523_000429 [Penicillium sp. IBT 18751x]
MTSIPHRSQPEMKVTAWDSWIGVTDPKRRRTLQNRLNQRSRRKRQRAAKTGISRSSPPLASDIASMILDTLRILGQDTDDAKLILQQLEAILTTQAERMGASPLVDLRLNVTRLNVLRALHSNLEILGYSSSAIQDDAQSLFTVLGPSQASETLGGKLPPALTPTLIQCTIPHHPWLDLIPFPRMRDNLILAQDLIDDDQLCRDMCGQRPLPSSSKTLNRGSGIGETGVLVWRNPWDPSGWEVTETFIKLWGWAIQDCWDLFHSTDAWRVHRGEKPLFGKNQNVQSH